ncbi:MAG: hypothetical protein KGH63_04900, partial [Candidatus Micrarchaeota archaeon]|nr:hypothetical protein [Candidatus Micrarchaeota archaeon]
MGAAPRPARHQHYQALKADIADLQRKFPHARPGAVTRAYLGALRQILETTSPLLLERQAAGGISPILAKKAARTELESRYGALAPDLASNPAAAPAYLASEPLRTSAQAAAQNASAKPARLERL